ncbi:MAG: hypothetical protein ACE5KU_04905, partial [Nitrososphaerales archaeon]
MPADDGEIFERRILLEKCFSPPKLFEIGRSLGIPYFKEVQSGWSMDTDRALYELASNLNDEQLKEVFKKFSPWSWVRFRGVRYTFENGRLSMRDSWDPLRISLKALLKKHGDVAKEVVDIISRSTSGVSIHDLKQQVSVRRRRYDFLKLLEELSQEGLIVPTYKGERYIEWGIPEEIVPQVQAEVRGEPPLYPPATAVSTMVGRERAGEKAGDYLAAERRRIEEMDREFDLYLNDLLKSRLEKTVKFGKSFSMSALAEYLKEMFGPVLYFDSFLSITQQYGLADIPIRSESKKGSIGMRTGFNLALFGEPGTGKSYSTRDMILGKSDGSVPPHGLPGRNRYAAGMTPARFIRIGQAYTGKAWNFVVPEFNDWFRSEGMVEILKLAMERGEIRYELHREVVGPYRFASFFSVNYNTQVFDRGYRATVRDPNFQAIEDRMICRLHRLTKQRYEEIAQSRLRMVLGESGFGETARKIRDHLTLTHAIETRHPLVKNRFPAKPPLITKAMLETVRKTREAILERLPSEGVPFSARLEDRSIRLASAL